MACSENIPQLPSLLPAPLSTHTLLYSVQRCKLSGDPSTSGFSSLHSRDLGVIETQLHAEQDRWKFFCEVGQVVVFFPAGTTQTGNINQLSVRRTTFLPN